MVKFSITYEECFRKTVTVNVSNKIAEQVRKFIEQKSFLDAEEIEYALEQHMPGKGGDVMFENIEELKPKGES